MSAGSANTERRAFRDALGAFATGVTVVTASDEARGDIGLTANSFNSVSLDPPMVLWSLAKSSGLLSRFSEASHFGVHILSTEQEPLSARFASRIEDRFAGLPITRGVGGVPLLEGCSAWFQCRTAFQYEGGDHIIFVGEVLAFEHFGLNPLLYHGGRYGKLMPAAAPTAQAETKPGAFDTDLLSWLLTRAHFQLVARLRPEIARHRLSEEAFLMLSVLATTGRQNFSTLQDMLRFMGFHPTHESVVDLVARGFVVPGQERAEDADLDITQLGRSVMVELMAVARAIEAEAESNLDQAERALLHIALHKVIRNSDPETPAIWRTL